NGLFSLFFFLFLPSLGIRILSSKDDLSKDCRICDVNSQCKVKQIFHTFAQFELARKNLLESAVFTCDDIKVNSNDSTCEFKDEYQTVLLTCSYSSMQRLKDALKKPGSKGIFSDAKKKEDKGGDEKEREVSAGDKKLHLAAILIFSLLSLFIVLLIVYVIVRRLLSTRKYRPNDVPVAIATAQVIHTVEEINSRVTAPISTPLEMKTAKDKDEDTNEEKSTDAKDKSDSGKKIEKR
ncbi:hypothetical protein PMAYCL1PPCAC_06887, partial [Pristionchus mayeri]